MSRSAQLLALLSMLALGAWLGGAWLTAPRPGIEKYAPYRVTDRDDYFAHPGDRQLLGNGAVMVTFLGTTTLLFDDGQTQFLIDGFLSRPAMMASLRPRTDPAVVDAALTAAGVDATRLAAVLVSHSHLDHALDVGYIVNKYPRAVLYGSHSTHQIGCGAGIAQARNRVVSAGDQIALGGFVVTVLPTTHSPHALFPGVIDECLAQPAWMWSYKEGGSFDFRVSHGPHTILVKGGANVIPPPVGDQHVDVLFLSTGLVGKQGAQFGKQYFDDTVARLRPRLVIPMHWDDFFAPLSGNLNFSMRMADDSPRAFDALLARIAVLNSNSAQPVEFRLLQGYESVLLFRPPPAGN